MKTLFCILLLFVFSAPAWAVVLTSDDSVISKDEQHKAESIRDSTVIPSSGIDSLLDSGLKKIAKEIGKHNANGQIDSVTVTAEIVNMGNRGERLKIHNYNEKADPDSPGRVDDESSWWHSKSIIKGYRGDIAGKYRFELKYVHLGRDTMCTGVINVTGGKPHYSIKLYDDCSDGGSREW